MNEKYHTGDQGFFDFTIRKKDKSGQFIVTPFQLYATIKEVEERNILIEDNDGFLYLVTKRRIKVFNKEEIKTK